MADPAGCSSTSLLPPPSGHLPRLRPPEPAGSSSRACPATCVSFTQEEKFTLFLKGFVQLIAGGSVRR
uniref:Uncharacterized protein n=1 Tax=Aegilops tauschii TaxID=37682 RepID=M8C9D2_AEGTA